jgi:hypothetical protein
MFARLNRSDDRVLHGVKVFRCVFVLGTVTASHMPAGQTQPQMDPAISHLKAFLAALGLRLNRTNLIGVCTDFSHLILRRAQLAALIGILTSKRVLPGWDFTVIRPLLFLMMR